MCIVLIDHVGKGAGAKCRCENRAFLTPGAHTEFYRYSPFLLNQDLLFPEERGSLKAPSAWL